MLKNANVVVVGVSGGADSVCLLTLLNELFIERQSAISLEAVHVNHGIRGGEADRDAEFVRALCEELCIPFHLYKEDIPKYASEHHLSEEEAGRERRYADFRDALRGRRGVVAVAHNADDRAETVLFHLFRGASIKGLAGIRPVNGDIIRPLLFLTRKEIEEFLDERGIEYVTDETNLSDHYTRNRIRHHILNYAKEEITPAAVENICRAAEHLKEVDDYLTALTERKKAEAMLPGGGYSAEKLRKEDPYMAKEILYRALCEAAGGGKDITREHVLSAYGLLEKGGTKSVDLPCRIRAVKEYDVLFLRERVPLKPLKAATGFSGAPPGAKKEEAEEETLFRKEEKPHKPAEIKIAQKLLTDFDLEKIPTGLYTKWFDYDKIRHEVSVRTRQPGDYLCVGKDLQRQPLKDYFINEKIPRAQRDAILLVADGSHILWVVGHRISEYYKVDAATKRVLEITIDKEAIHGGKD